MSSLREGANIWMEFHSDGNFYYGQGDNSFLNTGKWSVKGNKVKTLKQIKLLPGIDDDYAVFKDPSLTIGSTIIGLNGPSKTEEEGEKVIIKNVITRSRSELAEVTASTKLIQGFINAMANRDYEAFKKLTCLGMTKEQFKAFMARNDDRKVTRVWDVSKDDFVPEFNAEMREAFQKAQEDEFDWSKARIDLWRLSDDVKAGLATGYGPRMKVLDLHLDDCFLTPQGMLMFGKPKVKVSR